jgi:hypothetical protein
MAVQYPQAPSRQDQEPSAREEDAHQLHGKVALGAIESRRNCNDQPRRRENAD